MTSIQTYDLTPCAFDYFSCPSNSTSPSTVQLAVDHGRHEQCETEPCDRINHMRDWIHVEIHVIFVSLRPWQCLLRGWAKRLAKTDTGRGNKQRVNIFRLLFCQLSLVAIGWSCLAISQEVIITSTKTGGPVSPSA